MLPSSIICLVGQVVYWVLFATGFVQKCNKVLWEVEISVLFWVSKIRTDFIQCNIVTQKLLIFQWAISGTETAFLWYTGGQWGLRCHYYILLALWSHIHSWYGIVWASTSVVGTQWEWILFCGAQHSSPLHWCWDRLDEALVRSPVCFCIVVF